MFGVTTSDDYKPVAWMGRYPLDVTTLLVVVHTALRGSRLFLIAFGGGAILTLSQFDSAQVWRGAFWQLGTYAFVHPPSGLIWFAIEMYMLFAFGREVERFIGRRAFIWLYLLLLFLPSVFLTLWGLRERAGLRRFGGVAFRNLHRVRDHLSECRIALSHHGEMGCPDFGRSLFTAIARLSCVGGARGSLDKFRRGISVHSRARCGTGVGVVGQFEDAA